MVVDCSNNYIHNVDFSYLGYGVVKKGSQYPIEELEAKDGRYYYTRHGDADTSVTKLFKWNNIQYYVNNGKLDKTYTGYVNYNGSKYYVVKGVMQKKVK